MLATAIVNGSSTWRQTQWCIDRNQISIAITHPAHHVIIAEGQVRLGLASGQIDPQYNQVSV